MAVLLILTVICRTLKFHCHLSTFVGGHALSFFLTPQKASAPTLLTCMLSSGHTQPSTGTSIKDLYVPQIAVYSKILISSQIKHPFLKGHYILSIN